MVWTKRLQHPDLEESDQPNQRSEDCREGQKNKSDGKHHSCGGSTDNSLLCIPALLRFNTVKLSLHLGDLLIDHGFRGTQLVIGCGIGSKLTSLGQLLTERFNLFGIITERTCVLQGNVLAAPQARRNFGVISAGRRWERA